MMTALRSLLVTFLLVVVSVSSFTPSYDARSRMTRTTTPRSMGFLEDAQAFLKSFSRRATASHILIKGGAEAQHKLDDLKEEIDDSPVKFAAAAAQYSACPSGREGGNLGSFGPGAMVKEFDDVVFNKAVGEVHGPVKTQFGYHLIYINERND
jgi:peptidyl-prolyl cis-trans isomerase C